MKVLALSIALAGCYGPSIAEGLTCETDGQCPHGQPCRDGVCGGRRDAGTLTLDGPPVSSDAPAVAFCAPDPALLGCWELDGAATDASSFAHHGMAMGISYVPGIVGQAAAIGPNGRIRVGDALTLVAPTITIEAWIRPRSLPIGNERMGIIDNDGSYGMFLHPDGFRCNVGLPDLLVTAAFAVDEWVHLACTYDGSTMSSYVNGQLLGVDPGGEPVSAGTANGLAIANDSPSGEPLDGEIDQVRLWSVVRSPAQICAAAGASCP